MGVPVPTAAAARRLSGQQGHPYANGTGAVLSPSDFGHGRGGTAEESYSGLAPAYGRNSPMLSSVGAATPPALSNVRARGGEIGVATGEYDPQQAGGDAPRSTLWRILTCRCG